MMRRGLTSALRTHQRSRPVSQHASRLRRRFIFEPLGGLGMPRSLRTSTAIRTLDLGELAAILGSAVAIGGSTITYYKYQKTEKHEARVSYVEAVLMNLNQEYHAPQPKIELGILPRENEDELKRIFSQSMSSAFLLVGPSKSGKSTYIPHLAHKRKAIVYLAGREIPSDHVLPESVAIAFGCVGEKKGSVQTLSFAESLRIIKEALLQFSAVPGNPLPVFIFDDVHKFDHGGRLRDNVQGLLDWSLEMAAQGLMNFVMLTSERDLVPVLKTMSGFSSRLEVMEIPYVDLTLLHHHLTKYWDLRSDEVDYVLDNVGGNMGDLERISTQKSYKPVKVIADELVKAGGEEILNVYEAVPSGIDMKIWRTVSHSIFQLLCRKGVEAVNLVDVMKIMRKVNIDQVVVVARILTNRNILRDINGESVCFHKPRYAKAFKKIRDKEIVQEYVKLSVTENVVEDAYEKVGLKRTKSSKDDAKEDE